MPSAIRIGAIAAATAALLTATACSSPAEPEEDTAITIAVPYISGSYDPFSAIQLYDNMAGQAVYDGLFLFEESTNSFAPWLAESWEISEDRLTMTITLRDDVDFIDGTHLDAEGVETYLDAYLENEGSAYGYVLRDDWGSAFTATGEYELEVTNTRPFVGRWFEFAALVPILSPAALDSTSLGTEPVGSGPYLVEELEIGRAHV